MERAEAEAIYDAGREAVVEVLLAMDRRIRQLEARVEKLERQLAQSSRNSSLPPNSDPPGKRPARGEDRSGRSQGAQPGHEGHGRELLALAEELFGVRLCTGTVEAILMRAAQALQDPYQQLAERVRRSENLNMDETGWRTAGERRALWGMFTDRHALFCLAPDRHKDHAKSLLADTEAIVTSDRWWAYTHLPLARRQICCSHLKRDFQAHAEGLAAEKEFGEVGLELSERVFSAWEVFAHTSDRRELKRTIRSLQHAYKPIIRSFATKRARNKRCRGMARNLLKLWPALWTFASHNGIEPTNNHAERALRGAVIYRKLSLGSQSEQGERRIERLYDTVSTVSAGSAVCGCLRLSCCPAVPYPPHRGRSCHGVRVIPSDLRPSAPVRGTKVARARLLPALIPNSPHISG